MSSVIRPIVALAPLLGLLLSCGGGPRAREDELASAPVRTALEVRPDETTALRLNLPYTNRATILGYGAVQLWARPRHEEILVSAIADAPARSARWEGCRAATLGGVAVTAEYIGRPMPDGAYDAVRFDIGIHELRRILRGGRIRGSICGDPIELSDAQRSTLARFVRWFDRIARPRQRGDAPSFRDVGPMIRQMPITDDDPGPYPA